MMGSTAENVHEDAKFQRVNNFYKNCDAFIRHLDLQIIKNFGQCNIVTRNQSSNGLWCSLLLPTVLCLYTFLYDVSPLYQQTMCLAVGHFFYSILFTLFVYISCTVVKEPVYTGCLGSSLVSALLLYTFCNIELATALTVSFMSVYIYAYLVRYCLLMFPKTFTVGEAMVVTQGAILFSLSGIFKVFSHLFYRIEDSILVESVVMTALATMALIITVVANIPEERRCVATLTTVVCVGGLFTAILLHLCLGPTCLFQIISYVFFNSNRVKLFIVWLFLTLISVLVLVSRTSWSLKAGSVTRKVFHVLASLVFASGILVDVDFMRMAAGVGLAVLLSIEGLRKAKIEPMSSALQSAFDIYKDEKDCGSFAVTPIYMYVGLSCPLVLVPAHAGAPLEQLSGVLATGVGDTAASWFGERYGHNKWPGGNRTFEGTVFNILAQITVVYLLQLFELINVSNAMTRTTAAAIVVGLVEAKTEQVDNLILPLVMLIAFQTTFIIA